MAVGFAQACINGFKSALAGLNAVKIDLVYLKSQDPILVSEKPVEVSSTSRELLHHELRTIAVRDSPWGVQETFSQC